MRLQSLSTLALLSLGLFLVGCDATGLTDKGGDHASSATSQALTRSNPQGGQGSGTTTEIRVAHLSPDAPSVDVYVGTEPGEGDPTVSGLEYASFAPNNTGDYVPLEFGSYDIAVTPAGATSPQVIDVDDLNLQANKDYTILAVGELAPENDEPGIKALPLVDNGEEETALPPRDKTLVRFVHASPDAGTVDIGVKGGPTLVSGAEFGDASDYIEVAPGDYTITVGSGALEVPFTAEAGTKVTAYVIGNATPEDGNGSASDDEGLSAVTSIEARNPAGTGPVGGPGQ